MDVPVVTLEGRTVAGRAGVCLAKNLELPELIGKDEREYVQIAVELARDLPRLSVLRRALRSRLASSALMDARGFTRDLEAAYRFAWRNWCELQTHADGGAPYHDRELSL